MFSLLRNPFSRKQKPLLPPVEADEELACWINWQIYPTNELSLETRIEYLERDLQQLKSLSRVRGVFIRQDELVVETVPVIVSKAGLHYNLGSYRILVCPMQIRYPKNNQGSYAGFLIEAIEPLGRNEKNDPVHHPYSMESNFPGKFCFGESNPIIVDLLKTRQLLALIALTLEHLWQVNDADFEGKVVNRRYPLVGLSEGGDQ